ncbi:MAG: acyl-CoA synthetase [Acidimicrobiales bacterium]
MSETKLDLPSQASALGESPAVIMGGGESVSYAELNDRSSRLAHVFRGAGLAPGDHVAILMENNPTYLEATWGGQRSGLYYTAINSHLRQSEVQYILDDCGAKGLISTPQMAAVVEQLDLSLMRLRLSVGGPLDGFESYESALSSQPVGPIEDECEGREMLYSSGTTGRPKGVLKELPLTPLGDPSAVPVALASNLALFGLEPGAVYLSPAPLYHSAPLVYSMSALRLGAVVVVMESFDPSECLRLIEKHHVTHAQFVPTMFIRMLALPESERSRYDISSLRYAIHAAAPCPVDVKKRMLEWWGPIIHEYYAGTEDVGSTWITAQEWISHPGSVGRPMQPAHIVGEDGDEMPTGAEGVVYFEGGRPFEYHNNPDATTSMTNEKGWRTLGDVGRLDADGYLYLTDRAADMIISGGVNIYPREAEDVLVSHPAVADVAVIGVPDAEMGEAVKGVVQLHHPASASAELEQQLIDYCKGSLATYKCPRSIDFEPSLPRDPNGKLYKRLLKDRYWQGHATRVV